MNRPFDFEGGYGEGYERLARTVIPGYRSSFRQALALLEGRLGEDARILVAGAGTGIEIVTFGSAERGWRFVGVDPSAQMIDIAQHRVTEAGLSNSVELIEGYVDDLDGAGTFDAATCFNVMHFLADDGSKEGLLSAIAERLAPRAPLVLFDLHGDLATAEFIEQYAAWRRFWKIQGMEREARADFQAELEAGIKWIPETRILELLSAAGFSGVERFFRGLLYGAWICQRTES